MFSILHILPNDKFSPINIFENLDGYVNDYYCPLKDGESICFLDDSHVKGATESDLCNKVSYGQYDIVIFHSLPTRWYKIVLSVKPTIKVVWILWGYDVYYSNKPYPPICKMELYRPMTARWMKQLKEPHIWGKTRHFIKKIVFYKEFKRKKQRTKDLYERCLDIQNRVLERIDYCAPIFRNEMDLLNVNSYFHADYFPFQYTRWSKNKKYEQANLDAASFIQVGNSADPSGNVLDVINLICKRHITNKLYLPLAYGESSYISAIRKFIEKKGIDCLIQDRMLPYEEYCQILENCRVSVFGHIRQQASDTIHMSLLRGNKVFLYRDSIAYQYYKNLGFYVFDLEKELTPESVQDLLSEEKQIHNKELVLETVSIENVVNNVKTKLDEILKLDTV